MKRSELIFNIVSIPVDTISLIIAGIVSFYIRIKLGSYIPITFLLNFGEYARILLIAIPILLLIFASFGLYNLRATRKFSSELSKVVSVISIALLVVIVVFFFDQKIFSSRLIMLSAWFFSILFVILGRYLLKKIQVVYLSRGLGLHKLVIVTAPGQTETTVIEEVQKNKALGYRVIAQLEQGPDLLVRLQELYIDSTIEEILQANPKADQEVNLQLVEFARNRGLIFNFVPNLFDVQRNAVETETIQGIPVISLKNTPLDGWGKVVKRIFDIITAIICLILTAPLFLVIIILIKIDSTGHVLYAAPRGGLKKDFVFYKFRTMYSHMSTGTEYGGAEAEKLRMELWKQNARGGEDGPFLKIKDDPRVTKIGRFLRKTKLDEIPQFLNVLKGDMSMVGPRAHVIDEVERYRNSYRRLFTVKPGIFGLSQIAQMSWP